MTTNLAANFRVGGRPRGFGGDATLSGIVLTGPPQFFPRGRGQYIRGLGGECMAHIPVPIPDWLLMEQYRRLRGAHNGTRLDLITISLNFSTYNATAVPPANEMTNGWMSVHGRFHPNNLTWRVPAGAGGHNDVLTDYSVAPLMVRDHSFSRIWLRDGYNFGPKDQPDITTLAPEGFTMPPYLTFNGIIQGSGLDMLRPGVLDAQAAKLCGLVNLSSFINPEGGCTTGRGYYGFLLPVPRSHPVCDSENLWATRQVASPSNADDVESLLLWLRTEWGIWS
ncbi:hypothetical protein CkaCkLH20_11185 [Colletotrichum karsti]|uniref:Uncharacterized protein n=1 Tax=Colletotrichum karsti TaxID=1095194 RepID=A0A9P6HVK9_9PEZI|nr:uncharacterized protein CkaCkLH20_11185 [Colletotrichum karsti]KAF9871264.1 hypothetical protein CkaCkLH20_11185 [Colletotrichum karsti]